jgi:hypothetical protein
LRLRRNRSPAGAVRWRKASVAALGELREIDGGREREMERERWREG